MTAYRQRLADLIDLLRDGLSVPVLAEFVLAYGADAITEINAALSTPAHRSTLVDLNDAFLTLDAHSLLSLMIRRWKTVFEAKYSQRERAFVSELTEARVAWAHQHPVALDDVLRAADTAALLLEVLGASAQAAAARAMYGELLRQRFASIQRQAAETTHDLEPMRLPSWRDSARVRDEVLDGRLAASDFAADLEAVVRGRAAYEDADALAFFARTTVTVGLAALLANVLLRLSGQGGQPVVQLQTGYGGGKTHALLAAYHLAGGTIGLAHVPDSGAIRTIAPGVPNRLSARRAAITGTAFDAARPRQYADAVTFTIWGDIAYQLGGAEAYALVERADTHGIAPGAETWLALFDRLGPCLIVLDELVAFGRNLFTMRAGELPAGTFASLQTGLYALTEAVSRCGNAQLLVTLPQPGAALGGDIGGKAYDALASVLGRLDSVWTPITPDETGRIARQRIFDVEASPLREASVNAYHALYAASPADFPRRAADMAYALRFYDSFPLHPELTDRLYNGWAALERFQRTRGVLRILALTATTLWQHHDPAPALLPGSLPFYEPAVRDEFTGMLRLHGRWDDLVRREIDSPDAASFLLDRADPVAGRAFAHRRLARTLFFGTAPLLDGDVPRGLSTADMLLGTAHPGDTLPVLARAFGQLTRRLWHVASADTLYWLTLRGAQR